MITVRFTQKSTKSRQNDERQQKNTKQKTYSEIRHSRNLERSLNNLYKPNKAY